MNKAHFYRGIYTYLILSLIKGQKGIFDIQKSSFDEKPKTIPMSTTKELKITLNPESPSIIFQNTQWFWISGDLKFHRIW